MSVRYTIKCEQDDPLLRSFEETMSFVQGFRQMAVPASVGSGQLTALESDPEFNVHTVMPLIMTMVSALLNPVAGPVAGNVPEARALSAAVKAKAKVKVKAEAAR